MRDIRPEGNIIVGGNFTINEGDQNSFIPLELCDVDQLKQALLHHRKLAKGERKRINKISFYFLCVALIIGPALALWYFFNGAFNNAMFVSGLAGVIMPVALAIMKWMNQTVFEQRQLNTIDYINTLIRERE
jgi:hypothetical protein